MSLRSVNKAHHLSLSKAFVPIFNQVNPIFPLFRTARTFVSVADHSTFPSTPELPPFIQPSIKKQDDVPTTNKETSPQPLNIASILPPNFGKNQHIPVDSETSAHLKQVLLHFHAPI